MVGSSPGSGVSFPNFKKLAKVIFADKEKQKLLNEIIWPEVYLLMIHSSQLAEIKNTSIVSDKSTTHY